MASAQVCPVVGTTTTVLPPDHPQYDASNPEARCPVTNAKVSHHDVIHNHPSGPSIPDDQKKAQNALQCPALKNANTSESVTDATCPVVGPVSSYLPPAHPKVEENEAGQVCPVTNATLEHHKGKVHGHPAVAADAGVGKCPVASGLLK